MAELISLFLSAFLSATLLPSQSELVLTGIYALGNHSLIELIIIATCGNVLGAVTNWFLGNYSNRFRKSTYYPSKQIDKLEKYYAKYGVWTLMLSSIPIIGDPLTVLAGVYKVKLWIFLIFVTISKLGRYVVLGLLLHMT